MTATESRPRTRLGCEPLEARENPVGNVVAALSGAGELVVLGDGADNHIRVEQNAFGDLFILGTYGTTVNGQPGIYVGRFTPTGVFIEMGAGRDHVEVVGLFTTGVLAVSGGSGGDSLYVFNTGALGDIGVAGGADNDTVLVSGSVAANRVVIDGGNAYDIARVENSWGFGGTFPFNFEGAF